MSGWFRPAKPSEGKKECEFWAMLDEYGGPKGGPDLCSSTNAKRVFEFLQSDGAEWPIEQQWVEEWPLCEAHAAFAEAQLEGGQTKTEVHDR